ncbi:MAG TPA: hypothetical protein VG146_01485 [Verrucomicrobiae bacterium]|nr:hypothetical protein [Verrucomicrobiae bacterium]
MKKSNLLVLAAVASSCLVIGPANAQQLFKAEVNTVSVMTNDSGGLSYSHYGNRQIISDAAAASGLTDLTGLRLVYNLTADDLEVVSGTNDTLIATPIAFSGGVALAKTNGTVVERLSWVFLGTNTVAAGTLRARETSHFGTSNELTHFSLIGSLQFASPASDTNGAAIYSGNISAGPFAGPDHDDRSHGERGHGEHGHGD